MVKADLAHAQKDVEAEKRRLEETRKSAETAVKALAVLQTVAAAVQENVHEQVSRVVTRCLQAVGWDYEFKILFEAKRGKTEARLAFFRQGHEIDPTTAAGGGPLDVAALGLRLSCLMLATPKRRRLLVADEPYKHVNGEEYRENAAKLLEVLCEELSLQMVIVTGHEWLRVGKVVEL